MQNWPAQLQTKIADIEISNGLKSHRKQSTFSVWEPQGIQYLKSNLQKFLLVLLCTKSKPFNHHHSSMVIKIFHIQPGFVNTFIFLMQAYKYVLYQYFCYSILLFQLFNLIFVVSTAFFKLVTVKIYKDI